MRVISIFCCILFFVSCSSNKTEKSNDTEKTGIHEVVAKEAINANEYTYIKVSENDVEKWVAVTRMDVKIGGTYYYTGGFETENFESKELKKTFDKLVMLENFSDNKENLGSKSTNHTSMMGQNKSNTNASATDRLTDLKITPSKGAITIAETFSKKDALSGKKVKITGKVTKYNPEIMGKNWIHMQDGTESNGKYDLTITTKAEVKVDDIITIEGVITLNKDFGYGYFYEMLIEDAVIVK